MLCILAVCLMLFSTAFAKISPVTHAKPNYSLAVPNLFKNLTTKKVGSLDSIDVTCWFDNGVATDWDVSVSGWANGFGPYQTSFTLNANSANGVITRLPVGTYGLQFTCLSGNAYVEITITSENYTGSLVIYDNNHGIKSGTNAYQNQYGDQEYHMDFRPYPN